MRKLLICINPPSQGNGYTREEARKGIKEGAYYVQIGTVTNIDNSDNNHIIEGHPNSGHIYTGWGRSRFSTIHELQQ